MLSVIIPAFNEKNTIAQTIQQTLSTLDSSGLDYELLIVDDGSSDGTAESARACGNGHSAVKICGYEKNRGKGHALKYGFQQSAGDWILILDADMELPPSQIPAFIGYLDPEKADILIGSKRHPDSKLEVSACRRVFSKSYNLMVKTLFNLNITDVLVGLKLYRREVLEKAFPRMTVSRYAFDVELLAIANIHGYSIAEAPVTLNYRFNPRIVIQGTMRIFWDTMTIFYRARVSNSYREIPK
ncbi:glycosyltransferase [Chloroflexota bacterium]